MKHSLLATVSSAALGAGMLALLPVQAEASLVCASNVCSETVYTNSNVGAVTDWTAAGGTLQTLTIDQFNPGLNQHLKSVVITEGGSVTSTGTVKNGAATAQTFSFGVTEKLSLLLGTGTPSNFPLATGFNIAGSKSINYTALASGATAPFSWTSGVLTTFAPGPITTGLAAYIGSSTFTVDFASNTTQNISGGGGNINGTLTTDGIGFVSIAYNYTTSVTTPEPASMAVLGAALVGTGVVRRRRKA